MFEEEPKPLASYFQDTSSLTVLKAILIYVGSLKHATCLAELHFELVTDRVLKILPFKIYNV